MDECAAREWVLATHKVPRETMGRLDAFVAFLKAEGLGQNLISKSTSDSVWERHIRDSVQLLRFDLSQGPWLDLGSGAGFPGLIVALLRSGPVTLVEQRRLRAEFLRRAVDVLAIAERCRIVYGRIERIRSQPFSVISARAFAPLDKIFTLSERFSTASTRWILPKGRNAQTELEATRASWQGDFRLEPSLTDADAQIIVAERVHRRAKEKHRE